MSEKKLFYNFGELKDGKIKWEKEDKGKSVGTYYDTGYSPKCCMNDHGDILEVHSSGKSVFYNVGKVNNKIIDWSDKGTKYDTGRNPSIALNNNNRVVEVHQRIRESYGLSIPLRKTGHEKPKSYNQYFRYGDFDGNSIIWQDQEKGTEFTRGFGTQVSINNRENFDVGVSVGNVWQTDDYWTAIGGVRGFLSGSNQGAPQLDSDSGAYIYSNELSNESNRNPSMSINDSNDFIIVFSKKRVLYYGVGHYDSESDSVSWKCDLTKYGKGSLPSVSMNDEGRVVEIHKGKSSSKLYYKTGVLKDGRIVWNEESSVFFDKGLVPSVSMNNKNQILVVHESD